MSFLKTFFILSIIALVFSGCSIFSFGTSAPSKTSSNGKMNDSANMHTATMRPYKINGKTYYPTKVSVGDTYTGIASWYGKDFHGKKTSNGETYNMYTATAAHKTLPMNTMVRVTNLNNRKKVLVRINDRGPFVAGRIIDLSKQAAQNINMIGAGTVPVRVEVVGFGGKVGSKTTKETTPITIYGGDFMVQIGSFRNISGANVYKNKYNNTKGRYSTVVRTYRLDGSPLFRVFLRGFHSEAEARDFVSYGGEFKGAFIVRDFND